jgi:serine/threonine protein kinase
MSLAAGAHFGPYEVIALIGTSDMGEVYRARDRRLNRDVAIKTLPAEIANNPIRRARFDREAQAISRLNHPNICVVYDVGTHDGIAYLVMEYIEGESLAQRLRRGPVPSATALRWAIQIAGALDAAHRRGITHRDLKPANVMVSGETIKLLDFGLAVLHSAEDVVATQGDSTISLTAERSIVGTLHYMAPEQLEQRELDPRTDLFAFGAVLYEMLTARKAFEGRKRRERHRCHSEIRAATGFFRRARRAARARSHRATRALDVRTRSIARKDADSSLLRSPGRS